MAPPKREYLAVPYDERIAARAAGARWDATAKAWYIGAGADREALLKWLPDAADRGVGPREEFMEAMQEHGLLVIGPHPVGDGKAHRVPVDGDKGDAGGRYKRPSGQYALHLDGHPAGFLKNFRRGTYAAWKSSGFRLPPEQMAALRAEVAQREEERAKERTVAIEAAALRVKRQAATLRAATSPTGYMRRKGIAPTIGALTDRGGVTTYLPAIDVAGKQWTMQTIRRDGTKLFEEDSRKEGTFHIVGGSLDALGRARLVIISEGYATAAIVAEAALQPVVAAFDAGNILPVATALHGLFPDKPIMVAGDDDRGVELKEGHNPGRDKAMAAAAAVDGLAVFPQFAPGEVEADPRRFSDFNDLATDSTLGREGVKAQISAAIGALVQQDAVGVDRIEEIEMAETDLGDGMATDSDRQNDRDRLMDEAARQAGNRIELVTDRPKLADGAERSGVMPPSAGEPPSLDAADVPSSISGRYRVETSHWTGRRGYFESSNAPDAAFHDHGASLVSRSESPAIVADMVAIAQHRRWATLEVAGSEVFRREAWARARAAGLTVNGYSPSEREVQQVARSAGQAPAAETERPQPAPSQRSAERDEVATRQYLSVPFADKDAAKQAGAKWDRGAKSWYVDGDTSLVQRWVPGKQQAEAEKAIAADPNARAQLRAIEAVVGTTLANDPDARRRVLETGRQALADRAGQEKPIAAPQLRSDDKAREAATGAPAVKPAEPALPHRHPPERTRSR